MLKSSYLDSGTDIFFTQDRMMSVPDSSDVWLCYGTPELKLAGH